MNKKTFWTQLPNQPKAEIETLLTKSLGPPNNELNNNLLQEIVKKINSYYQEPEEQNYTTCSLIGSVLEISERIRRTGKRKGQVDYNLKLTNKEILQARQEDLPSDKWDQVKKLALLGKNLVFKYKKWFANKQILDFYPQPKK